MPTITEPTVAKPLNEFERLLQAQQTHFKSIVRGTDVSLRIDKLNRLKKWIISHQDDIRKAIFEDFRKPEPEVDNFDIKPVLMEIEQAKTHLAEWTAPRNVSGGMLFTGASGQIVYEPKGVVLIIAPWNFPFMLALGPLVSAVAAGCCVVLKPSEVTPKTAELIYRMIDELFKEEEIAVRLGDAQVSQALLKLPFDHIFFTGSPKIGRVVMRAAADNLTSVTLELGGVNPCIIDESADIRDTAEKMIWGKFFNCGQSCLSINYACVHHRVYDRLIRELKAALDRMYGSAETMSENPDYGRIVNKHHFERVKSLLDGSLEAGAECIVGGEYDSNQSFITPTILKDVPDDAPIMHNEIFGPLLGLRKYKDLQEVLDLINSKPKPLAIYVFATNKNMINTVINNTLAGATCINDTTIHFSHPNLPFGGVGQSGMGKAHGHHGFMAFTNERSVLRQRRGLTSFKLVYPPYTAKVKQTIQLVMKYL